MLYLATELSTWRPQMPDWIARGCQINDRCYRRLDPEYFAWLKLRMHAVKAAAGAGRVPAQAFDEARRAFNGIQSGAVAMFGEAALLEAIRTIDVVGYRPPLPDAEEGHKSAAPASPRVNPEADRLARASGLVDAIRAQALAFGWTMERPPVEARSRFYNPAAEQPWIRRIGR